MTKYIIEKYLFFLASVADLYTIWQTISLPAFMDRLWCWIVASVAFSTLAIIFFSAKEVVDDGHGPTPPGDGVNRVVHIIDSMIVNSHVSIS